MPYSTFFNLPEAKQQRLMDAVWQEFTTVSYMDASINRIIQNAGISRGSFYQYFSGKQDLFSYILGTIYQTVREMFRAQLTAHNNDLFFSVLGMYDLILWKNSKSRCGEEQRKICNLIRMNFELCINQFTVNLDFASIADQIKCLMHASGYHLETAQECFALLHILMSIGMSNLADTMRHPQNEEKNRQLLEQQLLIIRRGLTPLESAPGVQHDETLCT